jgi:hypothetical protein
MRKEDIKYEVQLHYMTTEEKQKKMGEKRRGKMRSRYSWVIPWYKAAIREHKSNKKLQETDINWITIRHIISATDVIPNKLHNNRRIMRVYCTLNHTHRPILPRESKYLYKYVSHILSHLQRWHSWRHNYSSEVLTTFLFTKAYNYINYKCP